MRNRLDEEEDVELKAFKKMLLPSLENQRSRKHLNDSMRAHTMNSVNNSRIEEKPLVHSLTENIEPKIKIRIPQQHFKAKFILPKIDMKLYVVKNLFFKINLLE